MLKSKLQICLKVLIYFGAYILLSSCSTKFINPTEHPDLVDRSWLVKDENCPTACWHGLELGVSSQAEVFNLTPTLSFIGTEKKQNNKYNTFIFPCKLPSSEYCLAMEFENNVLSDLWLYLNYQITFEQAVAALGPPDSFYYSRRGAEIKGCSLSVLWIKNQLDLRYEDPPIYFGDDLCETIFKNNNKLPKGLFIADVHYMATSRMNEIIEIVQQPETGQNYTPWNGFAK